MADAPVIDAQDAHRAINALLPLLSDMVEAATTLSASDAVAGRAAELANLCRDAAALADAIALIHGRSSP